MAACINSLVTAVVVIMLLPAASRGAALDITSTQETAVWAATIGEDVGASTPESTEGRITSDEPERALQNEPTDILIPTSAHTTVEGSENSQSGDSTITTRSTSIFVWSSITWTWVAIVQLLSGIVGVVGNFLVIIVLFQRRRKSRSMDTLIFALAWADFLTSICIVPIPKAASVPYTIIGQLYCRLIMTNSVLWWSITISTYILMSISVERYIAVVYPLYFKRFVTRRRVVLVIAVIVLLSTLSGIYGPFVHAADQESNTCVVRYMSVQAREIISYYWFCLRIVIPCLTMLVSQILIARELNRQSLHFKGIVNNPNLNANKQGRSVHLVARNQIIKMMVIVIITYFVCWSPNQIAYLGYNLGMVPVSYYQSPLHYAFTVLGFCNSCANPFIYAARFPEFRVGLKDAFTCAKPKSDSLFEITGTSVVERSAAAKPSSSIDVI